VEIFLLSDTKKSDSDDAKGEVGTLRLKAPRHIVLQKTVEDGSIKQSFSHGRSKNVVVQRKRKKLFKSPDDNNKEEGEGSAWNPSPARSAVAATVEKRPADSASRPRRQQILKPMSDDERKNYIAEQKRLAKEEVERKKQEIIKAKEQKKAEAAAKKAEEEAEIAAQKAAEEAALAEAKIEAEEKRKQEAKEAEEASQLKEAKTVPAPAPPEPHQPQNLLLLPRWKRSLQK
jgi:translation initiation factor IF-2